MIGEGREQKKQNAGKTRMIWLVLLAMILAAGALAIPLFVHTGEDPEKGATAEGGVAGEEEDGAEVLAPIELSITCAGDIMAHSTQLTAQYDEATGTYDFSNNYVYVKDYIGEADLALCNVETTFAAGKPTGYPAFNSPDSMADDIREAGFDVAITANNHMLDRGYRGMQRTLKVLRNAGLTTVGSQLAGEKETTFTLVDVKGLRVGVVAYTYETSGSESNRTMNGSAMSATSKEWINGFAYPMLDQDLAYLKQDIEDAKASGADIVIAYLHWGEEYQRSANRWQKSIAETVADYGADIIFASHPHVLQPVEWLEVAGDDGAAAKRVPVFYSMGNFISNQRAETLDNRYTEQGMLANVDLVWDPETETVTEMSMNVLPVWVDRFQSAGKQNYYIIPLDHALDENEVLQRSGHLQRAKQALDDVTALIGEEFLHENCFPADAI